MYLPVHELDGRVTYTDWLGFFIISPPWPDYLPLDIHLSFSIKKDPLCLGIARILKQDKLICPAVHNKSPVRMFSKVGIPIPGRDEGFIARL